MTGPGTPPPSPPRAQHYPPGPAPSGPLLQSPRPRHLPAEGKAILPSLSHSAAPFAPEGGLAPRDFRGDAVPLFGLAPVVRGQVSLPGRQRPRVLASSARPRPLPAKRPGPRRRPDSRELALAAPPAWAPAAPTGQAARPPPGQARPPPLPLPRGAWAAGPQEAAPAPLTPQPGRRELCAVLPPPGRRRGAARLGLGPVPAPRPARPRSQRGPRSPASRPDPEAAVRPNSST